MQNKYLVSLLITTFNRKELLKKLLDCLINQTYTNLEILIADNHSEDGTEDLCNEYVKNDNRIKYFRHEENIGMTNNTNFIFKQAKGDFITLICDDDWLDLDYVEKCVKFLDKHPDYTAAIPRTKFFEVDYKLIKNCKLMNLAQSNPKERIGSYIENNMLCLMATGLFKRSFVFTLLEQEGVVFNDRYAEDWIYVLKALATGKCKVLSNTNYNKLNNGFTSKLEASADIWDIGGINENNYWDCLYEKISDSILNDKFFKLYFSEKELQNLNEYAKTSLIKAEKKVYRTDRISWEYLWRHPFFLFRKKFYKIALKQFFAKEV